MWLFIDLVIVNIINMNKVEMKKGKKVEEIIHRSNIPLGEDDASSVEEEEENESLQEETEEETSSEDDSDTKGPKKRRNKHA